MHDLLASTADELSVAARAAFGSAKGAGVASAVHAAAVRDGVFAPERHGLGPRAAALWRQHFALWLPVVERSEQEAIGSGTLRKSLLRLADGRAIESVLLPMGRGRHSLCVSTQVGCARACAFCATGRMGLLRNLSAGEITGQVTLARCAGVEPQRLVFMGMGEPLDNFDALVQALRVLTDRHGFGYSQEDLTVCTVGNVPGIRRLQQLGWKRLGLNLSLNAIDDDLRQRLLPQVKHPLAAIRQALLDYRQRCNLEYGIHWCLLPGLNDTPADAAAIARFCTGLGRVLVHVIPYNPDAMPLTRAPEEHEIARFVTWLREHGLRVRRRITKGRSVQAACGQLAPAAGGPALTESLL